MDFINRYAANIIICQNARLDELDKKKYGPEFNKEIQTLRDIPQEFDLTIAQTPEELKELWPEQLSKGK